MLKRRVCFICVGDGLVVLSLFDGIGAALFVIARRLGIRIKRYYTSEVNKYAAMVSMVVVYKKEIWTVWVCSR